MKFQKKYLSCHHLEVHGCVVELAKCSTKMFNSIQLDGQNPAPLLGGVPERWFFGFLHPQAHETPGPSAGPIPFPYESTDSGSGVGLGSSMGG